MSEQARRGSTVSGPGSRTIAAALLETLTIRGRLADRERAARAVALDDDALFTAPRWLVPDAIAQMLSAASIEVPVARALGHRLIAPESMGMPLYALGLATPEKAYRRVQSLLPREAADAHWKTEKIDGESAWLVYRPHAAPAARPPALETASVRSLGCAVRRGMLEAIPTLYGLLPATVHETLCVARGDSVCRYRVDWQRSPRHATGLGAAVGVVVGTFVAVAGIAFAAALPASVAAVLVGSMVLAAAIAIGRSVDLATQLDAVGGTRRGQLALFEQVDDQLAAKLDTLARVDAKLDASPVAFRRGLQRSHSDESDQPDAFDAAASSFSDSSDSSEPSERERGVLAAAEAIHATAGDLECWFDAQTQQSPKPKGGRGEISSERAQVREIRDWALRISDAIASEARVRRPLDLGALVARGVASVRPLLPANAVVRLEVDADLEPVVCDPVQIEQVVIQLVRNAIEASDAILDRPEARVTLQRLRSGVEIAVEDRGAGIESAAVDEVFDPFFTDASIGAHGGYGLPTCLRIIEAHGGELRIESEDRPGTRVSIFLPRDGDAGSERSPRTRG